MTRALSFIDAMVRDRSDDAMSSVVAAAKAGECDAEAISHLANALARSGTLLSFEENWTTADLASTGAPSSLSTLLCPLYLRASGLIVPKLGVPGRPAGGIDVMAQISGYACRLESAQILAAIKRCGYAHFLADENFAPLDALFFAYRQRTGAQNVPALAAASLLAKKIASGVRYAGLDVRVASHGNFGKTFVEATRAARTFCEAARLAGVVATAILTDARTPYQPFIGRGEALLALGRLFSGTKDPWLAEHDDRCRLMAAHVAASAGLTLQGYGGADLGNVFAANIEAQGGSMAAFTAKIEAVERAHALARELTAPREGYFRPDLGRMRSVFVDANAVADSADAFPDRLGLVLRARPGAYVKQGDILATVRVEDTVWSLVREHLGEAFPIEELVGYAPGLEEIVRA